MKRNFNLQRFLNLRNLWNTKKNTFITLGTIIFTIAFLYISYLTLSIDTYIQVIKSAITTMMSFTITVLLYINYTFSKNVYIKFLQDLVFVTIYFTLLFLFLYLWYIFI